MSIDTVREALIKLRAFAKGLDCDYQEECTPGEDDMCESCKHVYIADQAISALSTIDPEVIKPSKDARDFAMQILDWTDPLPYYESEIKHVNRATALITAHDEAIRRECANAARNAIFDFGIGDKASNYYSPMIRKELAVQLVERAILGAELEKERNDNE